MISTSSRKRLYEFFLKKELATDDSHISKTKSRNAHSSISSIGTVAKLTGIFVRTVRAWPKRQHVGRVLRSSTGRYLHRTEDVQRLSLSWELTNSGHSIGNVASLDKAALRSMLDLAVYGRETVNGAYESGALFVCVYADGESVSGANISGNSVDRHRVIGESNAQKEYAESPMVNVALKTSDSGEFRRDLVKQG